MFSNAQPYTDYIGAGHHKGVVVTSSSDDQRGIFPQKAEGQKTISGEGLTGKRNEMARFLTQASFGFSERNSPKQRNRELKTGLKINLRFRKVSMKKE
ncbi:MAG: hypothetical protein IPK25_12405 [Saprospiraceae bacterium]|nr:hypothetical protein [Saprospiraceae bacterium]